MSKLATTLKLDIWDSRNPLLGVGVTYMAATTNICIVDTLYYYQKKGYKIC